MSDLDLSTGTRALLAAAKADAPSKLAKAKIWGGVAATTAAAAGAGAGAGSVAALGLGVGHGTAKLVVAGALFGSAVTVGLAMALMHVGPLAPSPADSHAATQLAAQPAHTPAAPVQPVGAAARDDGARDDSPAVAPVPATAPASPALPTAPAANAPLPSVVARTVSPDAPAPAAPTALAAKPRILSSRSALAASPSKLDRDDLLERESRLVAEARGALVRGDARASLAAVRAAQAIDSHALAPEELSLEARALRALGNEDGAAAAEAKLRTRYPDHALAR